MKGSRAKPMTPKPLWTGQAIGLMHVYGITQDELAVKAGFQRTYVTALLNGKRVTVKGEDQIMNALAQIVEAKTNSGLVTQDEN